jgi:hypothetical protein
MYHLFYFLENTALRKLVTVIYYKDWFQTQYIITYLNILREPSKTIFTVNPIGHGLTMKTSL